MSRETKRPYLEADEGGPHNSCRTCIKAALALLEE